MGTGHNLTPLVLYDLAFFDVLALDRCFETLEVEAPRLLRQDVDCAIMRDVQDPGAGQLVALGDVTPILPLTKVLPEDCANVLGL